MSYPNDQGNPASAIPVYVVPAGGTVPATKTVPYEQAVTGEQVLASAARSYVYNGDGTVQYEQISDGTNTFRKTYTYTNGQTTTITGWVKQ